MKFKPPYSDKELELQFGKAQIIVLGVFIPIFIVIGLISNWQVGTVRYNKAKYRDANFLSYSGKITKLEGDIKSRRPCKIQLDNTIELKIKDEIFMCLSKGDSVYKKANSDSVFYLIQNGKIIIDDANKDFRENYLEVLKSDK